MRHRISSSSAAALWAAGVLGLLAGGNAFAGLSITLQEQDETGAVSPESMLIGDTAMKMDTKRATIIFHVDEGRMITLDPEQHSYMEITKADRDRMAQQMAAGRARMAARMQAMPEAQRKQIEAMMAQHGAAGAMGAAPPTPRTVSYVKAGGKTVGQWRCTVYHKQVNGETSEDDCIVPLAALGLTRADFKIFEELGRTMGPSGEAGEREGLLAWDEQTKAIGFEGLPVESVRLLAGKPSETTVVKSIDHVAVPAGAFAIPAGYTKHAMPGFGGHTALPPPQ